MTGQAIAGKVVVITGASSGIGEATAHLLAQRGALVALAARREDRLQAIAERIRQAGGQALAIPTDVRDQAACKALVERVAGHWGHVDVLINNAGLAFPSLLGDLDAQHVRQQVEVNLLGVIWCSDAAAAVMRRQRSGHIITIGSVAGSIGLPTSGIYSATKFALEGFCQAARAELALYGVAVSLVCPGFITTEFNEMLRSKRPDNILFMPPDYVARRLARLIERPKRKIVIPWPYLLLTGFSRLLPGPTAWLLSIIAPHWIRSRIYPKGATTSETQSR